MLAGRSLGRVALSRHALPTVVPVTYRLAGQNVVFEVCSPYLAGVCDAVVAFEVDDVDPVTRSGWSVVAVGLAHQVAADAADRGAESFGLDPSDGRLDGQLVRLSTECLSGWRMTGQFGVGDGSARVPGA